MITKSDLQAIASVLKGLKPEIHIRTSVTGQRYNPNPDEYARLIFWKDMVKVFANMLSSNNPRFQHTKFYKACQYEETAP